MTEPLASLRRDYLPADLQPLLRSIGFDGSIAVQARESLTETTWLLELADAHPLIKGVVGWVDLQSPNVRQQLARFSPHSKFVGVRHVVQDEPDDRFMLEPKFQRGIAALREFDLTYDLLLFPKHLPVALQLVKAFPEQAFVLDHLAKPAIAEQRLLPWREDLRALAQFPNVCCKLSGMVTEAKWRRWNPEDFKPYLDAAMDCFGPDRLMIGSDWPVCNLSGEYGPTMQIVLSYVQKLSGAEQAAILGDNCARFYGISA